LTPPPRCPKPWTCTTTRSASRSPGRTQTPVLGSSAIL
jgi:hypothetical protein